MNKLLTFGAVGAGLLAFAVMAKAGNAENDDACQAYIAQEEIDMNNVSDDQELRLYSDYQSGRVTFDCAKAITAAYTRTHPT